MSSCEPEEFNREFHDFSKLLSFLLGNRKSLPDGDLLLVLLQVRWKTNTEYANFLYLSPQIKTTFCFLIPRLKVDLG